MSNKITIDGKEYTERSIEAINIEGVRTDLNSISVDEFAHKGIINVSINLKADEQPIQIQENIGVESMSNENSVNIFENNENIKQTLDENVEQTLDEDVKQTWIERIMNFIKKIFEK